jgi:hypothetical protein
MKAAAAVLYLLAAFAASSCASSPSGDTTPVARTDDNLARKYGLHESSEYHELIERAVLMANVVLADDEPIRLKMTWEPVGYYQRFEFHDNPAAPGFRQVFKPNDDLCVYENARAVPVYLIDDDRLGEHENSFVPDGESCVFINARAVEGILDQFYLSEKTQVQHYSSYERASVFTAMLLHEVGHLHYGDSGSYAGADSFTSADFRSPTESVLNLPSEKIPDKEMRADRFAVEQIQKAWKGDETPFLSLGQGRAGVANHLAFVINVSVNSFDYANDPWGYLNHRPQLNLLTGRGYTHLNLNLRLLIMLQQLEPTDAGYDALKKLLVVDNGR